MTETDLARMRDEQQREYVRGQVRAMVRAGFSTLDHVLQAADDMLESDATPEVRSAGQAAARREWEVRAAEQATWSDEGDYTALAAAFADLESQGVIARMNFTCCNSCGHAEIGGEIDPAGPQPLGYTFFHYQDSDRLADTPASLYLAFGGADAEKIGQLVAGTVARHGLQVEWEGDPETKVRVHITDWRKRLPGSAPS